jgi:GNAT superfamily N-acetyltransferase
MRRIGHQNAEHLLDVVQYDQNYGRRSAGMTAGTDIDVRLFDTMNTAPASQLAVAGWLHVEQSGFGTGELNTDSGYKAFVAYLPEGRDSVPVGVMTWDYMHDTMTIYQVFVVEEYRGRGVFRAMLDEATAKAIELNIKMIQTSTSVKHKAAMEVFRKTGFAPARVTLSLEVPQI